MVFGVAGELPPLSALHETLVVLVRRYAGLKERIGTAAQQSIQWCRGPPYARLQLEVAKRIVKSCAKGSFSAQCHVLRDAELQKLGLQIEQCWLREGNWIELGCRNYGRGSREAFQSRSSPDKRLLREEVAERRGTSARRLLSEEVAQQRSSLLTHPPTHPSIHPFMRSCNGSLIHGFMDSLILWFIESLVHWWFIDSLLQRFIVSLLHCFNDSLITTEIHSFIG